eukprot:4483205-Alexandrium_andersonii.AAC.1
MAAESAAARHSRSTPWGGDASGGSESGSSAVRATSSSSKEAVSSSESDAGSPSSGGDEGSQRGRGSGEDPPGLPAPSVASARRA